MTLLWYTIAWMQFILSPSCLQVNQVVSVERDVDIEAELLDKTFTIFNESVWIDGIQNEIVEIERFDRINKTDLIERLACSYNFPNHSVGLAAEEWRVQLNSNSIFGNTFSVFRILDENEAHMYIQCRGLLFYLTPCDDVCSRPMIQLQRFDTIQVQCFLPDRIDSVAMTQGKLEKVTERVLIREASSRYEVRPAMFNDMSKMLLKSEVNTCPDYAVEYDTMMTSVKIKEAYTILVPKPSQYETVTERVLNSEAMNLVDTFSLPVDTMHKELIKVPTRYEWTKTDIDTSCIAMSAAPCVIGHWDTIAAQIDYLPLIIPSDATCPDSFIQLENYCYRIRDIAATYGERTYERLIYPATTEVIEIPDSFSSKMVVRFSSQDSIPDSCIQRTYESYILQELTVPATAQTIEIPAEYGERAYKRLVQQGSIVAVDTTSSIYSFTQVREKQAAAEIQNTDVLCDDFLSDEIVSQLVLALIEEGYPLDSSETNITPAVLEAVIDYQCAQRLTIGGITTELLNHLQISF